MSDSEADLDEVNFEDESFTNQLRTKTQAGASSGAGPSQGMSKN